MVRLPGTTVSVEHLPEEGAFAALQPVFAVSGGGLSLSQVAELTGLLPTTIQNWVKRGWVESPKQKKYGPGQVARILIINLLRPTMQLTQILTLMTYINGRVDDRSDDIIPDERLYSLISGLLLAMDRTGETDAEAIHALVQEQLTDDKGCVPGSEERLGKALEAMLLSVGAAYLMQRARALYDELGSMTETGGNPRMTEGKEKGGGLWKPGGTV